ncbi:MAG: hypothetical protein WAN50_04725 [Minisyncoccia bacterium]
MALSTKNKKPIILIASLAIIAGLVCIAVWEFHAVTATVDTASWSIYSNTAYKYSIKYAPGSLVDRFIEEENESQNKTSYAMIYLPGTTTEIDIQAFATGLHSGKEYDDLLAEPLQQFASTLRQYQVDDSNPNLKDRQIGALVPITFAGHRAYSFSLTKGFTNTAEGNGSIIPDGVTQNLITVENNDGTKLLIRYPLYDKSAEEMIGTFAFSTSTEPSPDDVALSQLRTDLLPVTPHFIVPTWQQEQNLTAEEKKIATDVAIVMSSQYSAAFPNNPPLSPEKMLQFDIWLDAIGKRYILFTQSGADKSSDAILDSQNGEITPIPGNIALYLAPKRNIALYVTTQALYTYSLDQSTTTLVAGSQLSGNETYLGVLDGMGPITLRETHTNSSITIVTYDSSTLVPNPDGGNMYAKVGQKTLSFQ